MTHPQQLQQVLNSNISKISGKVSVAVASADGGATHVDTEATDAVKHAGNEEETMEECPVCMDEYALKNMFAIRDNLFCEDCLITDMKTKIRLGQAPTSPSDNGPISPALVAKVLAKRCTHCDVEGMEDVNKLVVLD